MRVLLGTKFNIVQEVCSFARALEYMKESGAEVDIVIGNPGSDPTPEFAAISTISQDFLQTRVIILTEWTSQSLLETALKSGAAGFLSKDISVGALLCSVDIVLLGERIIPTVLPVGPTGASAGSYSGSTMGFGKSEPAFPLSGREEQILQCLVDGMSNKLIARALDMTESTVKVHLKALLRKLRVQNRTQAAVWALNCGRRPSDGPSAGAVKQIQRPAPDADIEYRVPTQANGTFGSPSLAHVSNLSRPASIAV
jgi:two-component system nitrate/nitrite response regulator NarL